jgi:hypothetical protein
MTAERDRHIGHPMRHGATLHGPRHILDGSHMAPG